VTILRTKKLVERLAATLFVAGLGWVIAHVVDILVTDIHGFDSSSAYLLLATVLLAIGLFSSTYEIEWKVVRHDARLILTAVTLGVLVKAALIAGVMYLVFQNDPAYIVLAVAVAQIDPLSVAVMRGWTRLSTRARAILSAWSSFDDPVTAILAIYLSAVALNLKAADTAASSDAFGTSDAASMLNELSTLLNGLLGNGLLVVSAAVVWFSLTWIGKRKGCSITDGPGPKSRGLQTAGILTLAVAATVAVDNFLMLGLAAVGLFFRPGIEQFVSKATPVAFLIATFVLGLVLADGVNLLSGLVLGSAAFGAQIVVGMLMARSLPFSDRARVALGQQSGITAVILALILETAFPGTVAVVAPAILVINVLHLISNTLFDRVEARLTTRLATAKSPIGVTALMETSQPGSQETADTDNAASASISWTSLVESRASHSE